MTNLTIVTPPLRNFGTNFYDAAIVPVTLGKLKAQVQKHGWTCTTIDLANDYFRRTFVRQNIYYELNKWLVESSVRPRDEVPLSPHCRAHWDSVVSDWTDRILATEPEWVQISLFIGDCIKAAYDLARALKEKRPTVKILMSGGGVEEMYDYQAGVHYGDLMMQDGICDAFIAGEAELAILELLKGNLAYPGINNYDTQQVKDLGSLPYADYSDLNLSNYVFPDPWDLNKPHRPVFIVTMSRGCVYRCNYCDLNYYFKDFITMKADEVVKEIVHYYETYGVVDFNFSDTLINIDVKLLRGVLEGLIAYQEANGVKFNFYGMSVIRPKNIFPEEMFALMARAGFFDVAYGLESASPRVRKEMNKGKFSNEDAIFTFDMCYKYGMMPFVMLIIGYPTETVEDWKESLAIIEKYRPTGLPGEERLDFLKRDMFGLSVLRFRYGSELFKRQERLGITVNSDMTTWSGPALNSEEAYRRVDETVALMKEWGFNVDEKNYKGGNGLSNGLHGLIA